MKPARASAPGKAILLGEHAVVYGRPALAVPVTLVQAAATVSPSSADTFWIELPDLRRRYRLEAAPAGEAVAAAARLVLRRAGRAALPGGTLRIESTVPVASGLGSGAAVCTAAVRALGAALGLALSDDEVAGMVFETEKLLHGTPSGIDNTVIAHGRPIYFVKGRPPVPCEVQRPFLLLIGDTGQRSPTKITVGAVRAAWEQDPARYDALFDEVGALVERGRAALAGAGETLGPLLTANHALLREMGVSGPELERLVAAALGAGAEGAKLSGGGQGGNMLALVTEATEAAVRGALLRAGAARVLGTRVERTTAEANTPEC